MATGFTWGGRQWGPNDQSAFASWLKARGASYDGWAKKHPGAAARFRAPAPGRPAATDLYGLAGERASSAVNPELEWLMAERDRAEQKYKQMTEASRQWYSALAEAMKSVAPQIQGIYHQGASAIGALGAGFSDAEGAVQASEHAENSDFLNRVVGAPSGAVDAVNAAAGGEGAQDVLYGLGGYIPASTMEREGAGFAAAASFLPQTMLGQGALNEMDLGADFREGDQEFIDRIAAVKAKVPGLRDEILQQLIENMRAERALDIQEGYLGNTERSTTAELTGYDPVTGLPTPDATADVAGAKADRDKARKEASGARETAFAEARQRIFTDAKGLIKEETVKVVPSKANGYKTEEKRVTKPSYVEAKKALFNQYKDLLRYASRSGKPALRRRLNQIIDEALRAAGITPALPANTGLGAIPGVGSAPGVGERRGGR